MYKVLRKDTIETEIVPYLPIPKRGFKTKVSLCEVVNCILYKLKTGIQWHLLPILHLFSDNALHYKTIFGYYRKWCEENVWKACWTGFLSQNKGKVDLSSSDLDDSHTIVLRGGEEMGYQGRKKT